MKHLNKLSKETSPYLLQHMKNPVDWYPWCSDSLKKAKDEKKPILLSIGYSACHWCHVMAHESFENEDTAKIMNEHFLNIKVDREERPDIDQIYQTAHQILTQRTGGWPLTMFLDPINQQPFFGGTYFPNKARHGLPGFSDLLIRISNYFANEKDSIKNQNRKLEEIYKKIKPVTLSKDRKMNQTPITLSRSLIEKNFDTEYGGIGNAPKFPQPTSIERLLRHWRNTALSDKPDIESLFLSTLTLKNMAEGGIYDQLGGGFFRYSVDRYWQIPHFEKMLYDNGLLLSLYANTYIATGDELFKKITNETSDWILKEMRSENGGFYSSLNADSEGYEGKYYAWDKNEIKNILNKKEFEIIKQHFDLDQKPNFEKQHHLTIKSNLDNLSESMKYEKETISRKIDEARSNLLKTRESREKPSLDKKQLTSWNALVVKGLAISGRVLGRDDLVQAASKAIDFIMNNKMKENKLMSCFVDQRSKIPAYLDDHAFLLDAIMELLQSKWNTVHLNFAIQIADHLINNFFDEKDGGFFFTANDHEKLIFRPKPMYDDALPSGNGVAAFALQRLGFLIGDEKYLSASERTLENSFELLTKTPQGHLTLINTLEEYFDHPEIIIITGDVSEISKWKESTNKIYSPKRMIIAIPIDEKDLPSALDNKKCINKKTTAYVCKGSNCSKPIDRFEDLLELISENKKN